MTWILAGLALGGGAVYAGISYLGNVYDRELEARQHDWPLESDGIPDWVNQGDQPLYQRFITAIDFALWDEQMKDRTQ